MWATLVPVIVGGLLGLAGGLVGPWLIENRREKSERKKRREQKLEELVAAIYEHKHWLGTMRQIRVFGAQEAETISPFTKVEAIATVHFPNFLEKLGELERATDAYELWMLRAGQRRLQSGQPQTDGFDDVFRPTLTALRAALQDIREYAKNEFQ